MFINFCQIFGFFLLSGFVLPITNNRTNADFLRAFLSQALWVCVVVGYIRFVTEIPAEAFLSLFMLIVGLRVYYKPEDLAVVSSTSWHWPMLMTGGYFLFILSLGLFAFVKNIVIELVPRATIMGWDGILSWNNWALQLVQFEYWPYNAYYPSGFPSAWSVFYDLQDSVDTWIFSSLLMFGLLLFPLLTIGSLIADKRWSIAIFFASAIYVIGIQWAGRITNGYMDSPVTLLLFLGLFSIYLALHTNEQIDNRKLTTGFFFLSVAAVTKQPGIIGIAFGFVLLTFLFIQKNINHRSSLYLFFILLLPSILSGVLFYASGNDPIGNLETLRSLAIKENSSIERSFLFLISYSNLPIFFLLVTASIFSILRGGQPGTFSTVCLFIVIIGFFAYHDCCSYDNRNASWIYAFLFASAAPVTAFWKGQNNPAKVIKLTLRSIILKGCSVTLLIVGFFTVFNTFIPLKKAEAYFLDRIGGFEMHKMFKRNIRSIEENGLASFEGNLSFSTLVGPYHIFLNKDYFKPLPTSESKLIQKKMECDTQKSRIGCPLSVVLAKKPCTRILLRKPLFKNKEFGIPEINLFEEYGLVVLDGSKHKNGISYELLISSRFCGIKKL